MSSPAGQKRPSTQTFRWKTSLAELRAQPPTLKGIRSGTNLQSEVFEFMGQQWRLHLNQFNRFEGGPLEPPNLCLELLDYPPKLTFTVSVTCSLTLKGNPTRTRKFDLVFNRGLPWITLGNSKLWPWLGSSGYELWTLEHDLIFDYISCSMSQTQTDSPSPKPLRTQITRSPSILPNKRARSPEKLDENSVMILTRKGFHTVQFKNDDKIPKIVPVSPSNGRNDAKVSKIVPVPSLNGRNDDKAPNIVPVSPSNGRNNDKVSKIIPVSPPNVKVNAMSPTVSTTGDAHINSNSEELDHRVQSSFVRIEPLRENNVEKPSSVMKNMLLKKDFSDILLIGPTGSQYHAHKVVLSAWSPALHTLCLQESEIKMHEMSDEAIEGLLEFLYCESVSNMKKLANELFFAAERYNLEKLKAHCLKALSTISLTVENASDILIFAEKHHLKELKIRAMHFINQYAGEVRKTSGFKKLLESHLKLIAELYNCLISSGK